MNIPGVRCDMTLDQHNERNLFVLLSKLLAFLTQVLDPMFRTFAGISDG